AMDHFIMLFLFHFIHARPETLVDMIIKTKLIRHRVTFSERIYTVQQFLCFMGTVGIRIRPKISTGRRFYRSRDEQTGMFFFSYFDERVTFVIFKEYIIS